ncbi:MAG: CBS domain-containing protein [Anaerolineae bacterium]|jgi:acetoin utilization protein AcuB
MLVKDWMTKEPLVVSPKTSIEDAIRTMRQNRVRHLPVVKDKETLVGIVTQTDLLQASPSPATSLSVWEVNFLLARMEVRDAMTTPVVVVDEECPLEEAALVMAEHKFGCLPVVHGKRLIGIITETDLFNLFTEQLGARSTGVRLTLEIEDVKGALAELTGRISELGGNIVRLTTLPGRQSGEAIVTVKVEGVSLESLVEGLAAVGARIRDAREGRGWGAEGFSPYHWTLA